MRTRASFLALALLGTTALAAAQGATVRLIVVDAETGEPLPSAVVRTSMSAQARATDADGAVSLAVPAGSARVVVSFVGYADGVFDLSSRSGELAVLLEPEAGTLAPVEAVADRPEEWRRNLALFEALLLGATPNGRASALRNPEVLALVRSGRTLEAAGQAPLVVRNARTQYETTLFGLELVASTEGWGWDAVVTFEDLCADADCDPAVEAARAEACAGSPQHFLRSLAGGTAGGDGFRARLVRGPGAGEGPPPFLRQLFGLYEPSDPVVRRTEAGWAVDVDRALGVAYDREADGRPGASGAQTSWLTVEGGVLRFDDDGVLLDPERVTRHGYWDWERVADLVPREACAE